MKGIQILAAIILLAYSCKKNEINTDPRQRYVGTYEGNAHLRTRITPTYTYRDTDYVDMKSVKISGLDTFVLGIYNPNATQDASPSTFRLDSTFTKFQNNSWGSGVSANSSGYFTKDSIYYSSSYSRFGVLEHEYSFKGKKK